PLCASTSTLFPYTPLCRSLILSAQRTPIGAFLGQFSELAAPRLGAAAIMGAVQAAGVPSDTVDEVLMGCCLMAGLGQAPARQARSEEHTSELQSRENLVCR